MSRFYLQDHRPHPVESWRSWRYWRRFGRITKVDRAFIAGYRAGLKAGPPQTRRVKREPNR